MGSSLREQLLKAGLVDEKRARQADREVRQKGKQARKAKRSGDTPPGDPTHEAAERARQERELHAARSRELNRERDRERARRALRLEVRRMADAAALPLGKGDVRYNFLENKKVKRIYVDREQQAALSSGRLGIVSVDGRHCLVPEEVARKIRERSPETFVFLAEPDPSEAVDPNDPYADYPIPEDLDW